MTEQQKPPPKPRPEVVRSPTPLEGRPSERSRGAPPSPPELEPEAPLEEPPQRLPEIPTATPFGGD